MALQLLKRNYTMEGAGYERPKILKLPQGEMRWAPKRLPVDVGDVMMNMRMDDSKTKFVGESVSKYSQGLNPYGQWGQPYKVNKQFRPPIIDPKYYEPLSRMPVKFDTVTVGPIVKDLYGKKVAIEKVAPRTISDKICTDATTNEKQSGNNITDDRYENGDINLKLSQPHASIPFHPSMPVYTNSGVPEMELDSKLTTRAHAGIHAPFITSDQSRDVNNMRTPMHVAMASGYKDPYTNININPDEVNSQINHTPLHTAGETRIKGTYTADPVYKPDVGYNIEPKVQTSAWYNPSYYLLDTDRKVVDYLPVTDRIQTSAQGNMGYKLIQGGQNDNPIKLKDQVQTSSQSNASWIQQKNKIESIDRTRITDLLPIQEYEARPNVTTINDHQEYTRTRSLQPKEYRYLGQTTIEGESAERRPTMQTNLRSRLDMSQFNSTQNLNVLEDVNNLQRTSHVRNGKFVNTSI